MENRNPVFSNITYETDESVAQATYLGVSMKTCILLLIAFLVGGLTYRFMPQIANMEGFLILLVISSIVGFISVMVGRTSDKASKFCGAIYAACEGMFLGVLTLILNSVYEGVGYIAILGTAIIFLVMLGLYSIKAIRVTSKFAKFCFAFTIGAILITLLYSILGLFVPAIYANLPIFLGISALLLIYGAITLILNFEEAVQTVNSGSSKDSEWRVALGLTVSIIYIYIQLIRILAVLFANNRK